jgi:hypothetical protein
MTPLTAFISLGKCVVDGEKETKEMPRVQEEAGVARR